MIERVASDLADVIIKYRLPLGKFYTIEKHKGKNIYIGIDNEYGDAWTEDFNSLGPCKKWLEVLGCGNNLHREDSTWLVKQTSE